MTSPVSRTRACLAIAAAFAMTALPVAAQARGWDRGWGGRGHRHDGGVDAGDIFAGILILGGIAAIASAASKADKASRDRPATQDLPPYPGSAPDQRYGAQDDRPVWREGRGLDSAVDGCASEIERSGNRVDTVDAVAREEQGWRVQGRVAGGKPFACTVDGDGRIRSLSVDGRAPYAGGSAQYISKPVVQPVGTYPSRRP